jgi:enoyl-[acyl-carrier protein] reductase I
MSDLLKGKRGVIMGLANQRSIAWGVAKACSEAGAELAISYQGETLKKRVEPLAAELNARTAECDVAQQGSVETMLATLGWEQIDFVCHAIAFSDKEELTGRFVDTSPENFTNTMNISCFSLIAVAKAVEKYMKNGGAMITLSYYGAEKAVPHYNVMGVAKAALEASVRYLAADLGKENIRVNAISAGTIKTLAAAGISGLRLMLNWNEENAPLRRNVSIDEVGQAALYLLSDMSSAVTGETHYVDAGYNIIGMKMDID